MRKIELDLRQRETKEKLHTYLEDKLSFPSYYGRNLDALYDLLTEIREDTCIGIHMPDREGELSSYIYHMARVFCDAERENDHLCIFLTPSE